jgi:hypothetical protein
MTEGPFLPPQAPGGEPPPRFGQFTPPVDNPPPAAPPHVTGMPKDEGNGVGITAFALGIAGLVMFVLSGFGLVFVLNLPLSISAWVLGPRGMRKVDEGRTAEHRSLARAGHVMGIVGTVLGVVALIAWILVLSLSADARDALSG